jgi:hypothetical protein
MSHFTVTVVVAKDQVGTFDDLSAPDRFDSITRHVTAVLAPFDEDEEFFREGSRWDWWVVGGRWAGYFISRGRAVSALWPDRHNDTGRALTSNQCDVVRCGDVDWEAIRALHLSEAARYWDEMAARGVAPELFGIDPSVTRDEYLALRRHVATHSLVTKDGEWREMARMGWFSMTVDEGKSRETWEDEYLAYVASLDDEDVLVLVDAHV